MESTYISARLAAMHKETNETKIHCRSALPLFLAYSHIRRSDSRRTK